jgi:hypothetical protein
VKANGLSAWWQGVLAGLITFLVISMPSAAIVYGARAGSIGSVSVSWFGTVAAVVLGAIAVAAAAVVFRAYRNDPQRRPGEIWSIWFSGFVVLVVGSWFVPFVVLFVFVDSDRALSDRMAAVLAVWTLGHLGVAWLARWMTRSLRGSPPAVGPS